MSSSSAEAELINVHVDEKQHHHLIDKSTPRSTDNDKKSQFDSNTIVGHDLLTISLVSKRWKDWADNESLWQDAFSPNRTPGMVGLFRDQTRNYFYTSRDGNQQLQRTIQKYRDQFGLEKKEIATICPACTYINKFTFITRGEVKCEVCETPCTAEFRKARAAVKKNNPIPTRVQYVLAMKDLNKHANATRQVRAKKANYDEYKKQERIVEDFIDPEYLWGTFFGCISLAMFISVILLNLQLSNDIDLDFITMSTPYLVALGSVSLLLIPGLSCVLYQVMFNGEPCFAPWQWTERLLTAVPLCIMTTYTIFSIVYAGIYIQESDEDTDQRWAHALAPLQYAPVATQILSTVALGRSQQMASKRQYGYPDFEMFYGLSCILLVLNSLTFSFLWLLTDKLDDDTHSWAVVFIPGYICLAFAFCGSLFVFLENADGVEEYVFGICVSLCAVAPFVVFAVFFTTNLESQWTGWGIAFLPLYLAPIFMICCLLMHLMMNCGSD